MSKNEDDIRERVAKVEESAKSAHKRIDGYEENIKNIQKIAINVESLAGDVKVFAEKLVNTNDRLCKVEDHQEDELKKPGKMVDSVKIAIITGIFVTIAGSLIALILK